MSDVKNAKIEVSISITSYNGYQTDKILSLSKNREGQLDLKELKKLALTFIRELKGEFVEEISNKIDKEIEAEEAKLTEEEK